MFRVLTGLMLAGAVIALLAGLSIAIIAATDPQSDLIGLLLKPILAVLGGFFAMGLLTVLAASTRSLLARAPEPASEPGTAPAPDSRIRRPKDDLPDVKTAFQQMRTYIDLEMWELALDKATDILSRFAGTNEAELVSKNLPELKWKVETRAAAPAGRQQLSTAEERALKQKGLAELVHQVRTYCDLGMWELARQKAIALMKGFPETPEGTEMARMFPGIEKKAAMQQADVKPETPVTSEPS